MCSPSWTPLPPPSLSHPSGSSQCTRPRHLSHASISEIFWVKEHIKLNFTHSCLFFDMARNICSYLKEGIPPGGSVDRPWRFQCGRLHSILGWRTGIPKATQCGQMKEKKSMCVPHIFLESTVTDGSAEKLSILPNVKRNKDMHSSILWTTGALEFQDGSPDILIGDDKNASLMRVLVKLHKEM